jgi:cytochrome c-type biogenesis protein CcmH/NrfG
LTAAAQLFRRVLERDPNYVRAAFNLGVVYFELGEVDLAEKEWSRVLESAPDSELALQAEENLTTLRDAGQ